MIAPDDVTLSYLKARPMAPQGADWDAAVAYWRTLHSDDEALPAACTERGVIDVGMVVGGLLTRLVRAHFGDDDVEPVTVMNMASLTLNRGGWVL